MNLLVSLQTHLDAQGCAYERDLPSASIHFGMDGEHVRWRCLASEAEACHWSLVSLLPLRAAPVRRAASAELCARINWELAIGHFDLDFAEGELRYTTTAGVAPEGAGGELLGHLLAAHRALVDRFVPLFARVLFSGADPAEALAASRNEEPAPRFSLN